MQSMYRLRKASDIRLLLMRGQRMDTPLFQVVARRTTHVSARFLFIVSKAVDKRAVVRNRLRRRAREWVRAHVSYRDLGIDAAFILKKAARDASRAQFYETLKIACASIFT